MKNENETEIIAKLRELVNDLYKEFAEYIPGYNMITFHGRLTEIDAAIYKLEQDEEDN